MPLIEPIFIILFFKGRELDSINKSIDINIQSDLPAETNAFTFSKEKISSYDGNYTDYLENKQE